MGLPLDTRIRQVFPITQEDCYYIWCNELQIDMECMIDGKWVVMFDDVIDNFDFSDAFAYFDNGNDGKVLRVLSDDAVREIADEEKLLVPHECYRAIMEER